MGKDDVKQMIHDVLVEDIVPHITGDESGKRLSVNKIVEVALNLVHSTEKTNSELIGANIKLQQLIEHIREDFIAREASYKAELHSAKERCNRLEEQHEKTRERFDKLQEQYFRLVEKLDHVNTTTAQIKINGES